MCPKPNHTKTELSKQSHVEDLQEPIPTLFQSLVAEPDSLDRWFTLTFPIDVTARPFKADFKKDFSSLTRESMKYCINTGICREIN